jgi:hypothetical protein
MTTLALIPRSLAPSMSSAVSASRSDTKNLYSLAKFFKSGQTSRARAAMASQRLIVFKVCIFLAFFVVDGFDYLVVTAVFSIPSGQELCAMRFLKY